MEPKRPSVLRAAGVALALAVALAEAGRGLAAAVKPLTLYQKTARAALVVRARALSDATRRPPLEVLEVLKGYYPGKSLSVVPFVQDYGNPKPWLRREVFHKDEEYVLFLNPYEPDEDSAFQSDAQPPGKDEETGPEKLFVVLNADQGQINIPEEGAAALTEAVRRFTAILSLGQHDVQGEALRGLLRERNPYLVEGGLEEVERFSLAVEDDVPTLLNLLKSDRPPVRAASLRIFAQIAEGARASLRDLHDRQEIFTRVVDRAYSDPAIDVRREAVKTLLAVGGDGTEAVLRAVSRNDADQQVRYEAQVALVALSGGPRPPGENRRP